MDREVEENMQQQISPVKAVRLENFAYEDWLAALSQRLLYRYPGGKFLYQKPSVVIVLLNTSKPWGKDDEAFFAELRTQSFFQRWEPLSEVPPLPKANSTAYEDIGYRIGSGIRLTPKQQEALFSQLNDLEVRATTAEREATAQRNRATSLLESNSQLTQRHNHLVAIIEAMNNALQITVHGDLEGNCEVVDSATGRVLLRDTPFTEVYHIMLPLRQEGKSAKEE